MEIQPIRIAAQLAGVHPQTIRQYADEGRIEYVRTPYGQRRIHKESLQAYLHPVTVPQTTKNEKTSYVYARVSLEDLHRQVDFLQSKYPSHLVIQDIASDVTFKRKGLQTILDACLQSTLGEVVVAHRDRLSRFRFASNISSSVPEGHLPLLMTNEIKVQSRNSLKTSFPLSTFIPATNGKTELYSPQNKTPRKTQTRNGRNIRRWKWR